MRIEPNGRGQYSVVVPSSPAGEGHGPLRLPLPAESFWTHLEDLGDVVREGTEKATRINRDVKGDRISLAGVTSEKVGEYLFHALFSEPVRSLLDRSLGWSRSVGRGLRLKLQLDLSNPDLLLFASLPWELLFWREGREYLCLGQQSPLMRALDVPRPIQRIEPRKGLRVLVAIAGPQELSPLSSERERAWIERALQRAHGAEACFLEHATPEILRKTLLEHSFNIFHFIGHGHFNSENGEGSLAFEDGFGGHKPLTGTALANLMRDLPSISLVVLNTCNSARTSRHYGIDPFAGVAAALMMMGITAVVSMQFPISDRAALAFSRAFYQRIAANEPIEAAVVEGRLAILLDNPRSLEWATPALFMRTPKGSSFNENQEMATFNQQNQTVKVQLNAGKSIHLGTIGEDTTASSQLQDALLQLKLASQSCDLSRPETQELLTFIQVIISNLNSPQQDHQSTLRDLQKARDKLASLNTEQELLARVDELTASLMKQERKDGAV